MYISFRDMLLFFFLICFIVITVFLSMALYRLIQTLKSVHIAIEENREHINDSVKSISGICGKVEGVSSKISSKIDDDEISSFIPSFIPYITGAISFIVSIFNVIKSNKESK
ncbi:hypothetical protein [Clostridium cylindrosporum]|uniref:DUF948 domain-containing protein n=1 Tax=Clostridium cylindrosporum DSM 605 TaxID=1121307 RepID=A0A0J8DGL7_CLOCY|nr:hypothetical protein [Clostridium cylindrosporum]KMT23328.1 hypothetical protein CLCY_8c00640 [Clostridium cylindrosporum DSM 605]